jgi:hypothetical protein
MVVCNETTAAQVMLEKKPRDPCTSVPSKAFLASYHTYILWSPRLSVLVRDRIACVIVRSQCLWINTIAILAGELAGEPSQTCLAVALQNSGAACTGEDSG